MKTKVFDFDEQIVWNAHGVLQMATLETLVTITRDLPRSKWAAQTMTRKEQSDYICREILGITDKRLRDAIWRAGNEE